MQNIFFFQTQQISDHISLFNQFKEQKIFYSYFNVDQNYYLFVYAQQSIDINFLYQSVEIIQELDSKQRKIRSFRGFFLYALEILEKGEEYEILETNLQPFFWRKVQNIIRQNKKGALLEFLFRYTEAIDSTYRSSSPDLDVDAKIQTLQNQVQTLQQKVFHLETLLKNSKYPLSEPRKPSNGRKTIQQGNYTLRGKKALYLTENESEVRNPTYQTKDIESKSVSDAPKIDFNDSDTTQQYNDVSNQKKTLNQQNFITLSNLSEEERVEIIKLGFQLNQEGKISLKKYYESKDPFSLFQLRGYKIKYETIRRTKLYQQLKF